MVPLALLHARLGLYLSMESAQLATRNALGAVLEHRPKIARRAPISHRLMELASRPAHRSFILTPIESVAHATRSVQLAASVPAQISATALAQWCSIKDPAFRVARPTRLSRTHNVYLVHHNARMRVAMAHLPANVLRAPAFSIKAPVFLHALQARIRLARRVSHAVLRA